MIHRGAAIAGYQQPAPAGDGTPAAVCPDKKIDPARAARSPAAGTSRSGAIRIDLPRPPVHARNLFHLSAVMWDAWATYDKAIPLLHRERHTAGDVAAARVEAISYAAYRLLLHRYQSQVGGAVSAACFRAFMQKLAPIPTTPPPPATPARHRQPHRRHRHRRHPGGRRQRTNNYADTTGWTPVNRPGHRRRRHHAQDPSIWQQLNLAVAETQNGIVTMAGVQKYIGSTPAWCRPSPWCARARPDLLRPAAPPHLRLARHEGTGWSTSSEDRRARHPGRRDHRYLPGACGNNPSAPTTAGGTAKNPPPARRTRRRACRAATSRGSWRSSGRTAPFRDRPATGTCSPSTSPTRPASRASWAAPARRSTRSRWDVKVHLALNGAVHDAAIAAWGAQAQVPRHPAHLPGRALGLGRSSVQGAPALQTRTACRSSPAHRLVRPSRRPPGSATPTWPATVGGVAVRSWLRRARRSGQRHRRRGVDPGPRVAPPTSAAPS